MKEKEAARLRVEALELYRHHSESVLQTLQPYIDRATERGETAMLEQIQRLYLSMMEREAAGIADLLSRLPPPPVRIR